MIIMFVGPSGSGKDFFYRKTLEAVPGLMPIRLCTTRPMREGEVDGREYDFITLEKMNLLEQKRLLVERRDYETQHGIWSYATPITNISFKEDYLTLNTWEGYEKFNEFYGKDELIAFYFSLDPGVRLERVLLRERHEQNPKYSEMCRRFLADEKDFTLSKLEQYKPIIIDNNGTIEETEKQIEHHMTRILKR